MSSMSSPDNMVASFLHTKLPEVGEDPPYQELVVVRNTLNRIYTSITTQNGVEHMGT